MLLSRCANMAPFVAAGWLRNESHVVTRGAAQAMTRFLATKMIPEARRIDFDFTMNRRRPVHEYY